MHKIGINLGDFHNLVPGIGKNIFIGKKNDGVNTML